MAQPIIKWVGGKGQLKNTLAPLLRVEQGRYYEPMIGGGAMFFHLAPPRAVIADLNPRLVAMYRGVQADADGVIDRLERLAQRHQAATYYAVRKAPPSDLLDLAAWMIYICRACFNGVYRENRQGVVNSPLGLATDRQSICVPGTIRAAAAALAGVEIRHGGYQETTADAGPGDTVYFDPPYLKDNRRAGFTSYTSSGFSGESHRRLSAHALSLHERGVRVLVSNSGVVETWDCYDRSRWVAIPVMARRAVSRDATTRGPVMEVILRPSTDPQPPAEPSVVCRCGCGAAPAPGSLYAAPRCRVRHHRSQARAGLARSQDEVNTLSRAAALEREACRLEEMASAIASQAADLRAQAVSLRCSVKGG